MAKCKSATPKQSTLKAIENIDDAMKEMAERTLHILEHENALNDEITKLREKADTAVSKDRERICEIENDIKLYLEEHKKDFDTVRTRITTFGFVGFRLSPPKLELLKKMNWKKVLENMRANLKLFRDYIRYKVEINKELIISDSKANKLHPDKLASIGLEVVQKDEPFVELNLESLETKG